MAATDVTRQQPAAYTGTGGNVTRRSTETKQAFKTTEFFAYIAVLAGILIAGLVTKAGDGNDDRLQSSQVWLYATLLTLGYLLSRGLAKSGSRDPYTDDGGRR
jgi:hypothetical protein